jgi:hypothetical protein
MSAWEEAAHRHNQKHIEALHAEAERADDPEPEPDDEETPAKR